MKNNSYTGVELSRSANLYHSSQEYSELISCTKSSKTTLLPWYYSDASSSNVDLFTDINKEKICRVGNIFIQGSLIIANNNIRLISVEKPVPLAVI